MHICFVYRIKKNEERWIECMDLKGTFEFLSSRLVDLLVNPYTWWSLVSIERRLLHLNFHVPLTLNAYSQSLLIDACFRKLFPPFKIDESMIRNDVIHFEIDLEPGNWTGNEGLKVFDGSSWSFFFITVFERLMNYVVGNLSSIFC